MISMHSRFLVATRVLGALLVTMGAVLPNSRAQESMSSVVTWSGALSRPTVHAGEKIAVTVTATVQSGYHIYSMKPVNLGPQATEVTVSAAGLKAVGKPVEPAPKTTYDASYSMNIGTHEGTTTFVQVLSVPKTAKPGSVPVKASVLFMACNNKSCLPPVTVGIKLPAIKVEAGAARKEFAAGFVAPKPQGTSDGTAESASNPATP